MMNTTVITKIKIDKLFGHYNYVLPETGNLSNASILYGDNGLGKSTIIRLVAHLLSAKSDKGHRTAMSLVQFKKITITLADGHIISASKSTEDAAKTFIKFSIHLKNELMAEHEFVPGSKLQRWGEEEYVYVDSQTFQVKHRPRAKATPSKSGQDFYYKYLAQITPRVFSLNADRRLEGDGAPDIGEELEWRRAVRSEDGANMATAVTRSREIALTQAINGVFRFFQRRAVVGANQGSTNVHSVYVNVVKHLTGASNKFATHTQPPDATAVIDRLINVEKRTLEYAEFEIAPSLSIQEFVEALADTSNNALAAGLLEPYVESLESRLTALDPLYQTISIFVRTINLFLNDKKIEFKLSSGFKILSTYGDGLNPPQLSSGEQHLLLLFCHVVTAGDVPTVFMIDEPEISLNVKWQRQLLQALIDVTDKNRIQFILASHSLELISQHRGRVVQLVHSN